MNVCFVCDEYPPGAHGGIGTCTQLIARALVRAGHGARVVGTYRDGHGGAPYEDDQGVRVWRLRHPRGRLGWVPARVALYRQVAAWARAGEIDLVEVPDWAGWAAGWPSLPVPVVARLNGSATFFAATTGSGLTRGQHALERRSLGRATHWCAASRHVAEASAPLFGLARTVGAVLYNPITMPDVELPDVAPSIAARAATDDVVFTGTLVPKKGIVSLVRAWPAVLARRPEATLHVFGKDGRADDGTPMRAHLESLLPEEARARVRFHGHAARATLYAALARARAAVFPSYAEAFGIAPFEAMACGCPTIYTRREPGPELVRDGVDGLLVDPDRPEEIAAAIVRLLEDDALAARLGAAGRARVASTFAIDVMLPRNVAFYRDCVDDFAAARGGARRRPPAAVTP